MLLYPIVDVDACEAKRVHPAKLATWLYRAGVTMLQLRAKGWEAEQLFALVQEVQRSVPESACRLIVNDQVTVAARASVYGVHVGQSDLAVPEVRIRAPGLAVGLSTHNMAQVNEALRAQPNYVAIGPIFETTSKRNPEPSVGFDGLLAARLACQHANVPLVAIGGITASNVGLVRPHCDYVAVISAITHADERSVVEAVHAFQP